MNIFTKINQLIENRPERTTVGSWDVRDMDADDHAELDNWEEDVNEEGGYLKEINGRFYKIVITSINTD